MVMMFEIDGEKIEDERLKQQRIRFLFFFCFFFSQLQHPFSQIISLLVCRNRANWNDCEKV